MFVPLVMLVLQARGQDRQARWPQAPVDEPGREQAPNTAKSVLHRDSPRRFPQHTQTFRSRGPQGSMISAFLDTADADTGAVRGCRPIALAPATETS